MKYRVLGRSGLKVSEICLGAMAFGEDWGIWRLEGGEPEAIRTVRRGGG